MPTTRVVSTTIVEFTEAEANTLIADHLLRLSPEGASLHGSRIAFQLNQPALASALAALIPGLPAQFTITQGNTPQVALRVSFLTPPTPTT